MPGLRHAHTLQQLKDVDEYSPPGEYLINNLKLCNGKNTKLEPTETQQDKTSLKDSNVFISLSCCSV